MTPTSPAPLVSAAANPFPGLRAFEADETHLFFGRDGQSTAILTQLQRHRFVGVVGTSGSGKSSLVRAGLLPQLEGGFMTAAGSGWRFAVLKPGDAPLRHLAQALGARGVLGDGAADPQARAAQIEAVLRRGSLGLIDAVAQARLDATDNVLVVVDQFEEIFRMARLRGGNATDEADHFVAVLLEAAAQTAVRIYVVLTMRSDFLGDCARFRGLPEALNRGQYLVPRMSRDERRAAIEGPVAVGGATISARLVQQILNEVGDRPDQLPVMQHALMRTWEDWAAASRPGQPIDLPHYTAIGGLGSALDQHANEALQSLTGPGQVEIARLVFQRLCERATDYRETRRPTRLAELAEVAGADLATVSAVIAPFRSADRTFLMPLAPAVLEADTVVDISHEALIRQWATLRRWADEEAESAAMYRRLAEDAALYAQNKVPLWRDPQLRLGRDWQRHARPSAAWAARYDERFDAATAFLDASGKAHQRGRVAFWALFGLLPLAVLAGVGVLQLLNKNHEINQINGELTLRNSTIESQSAELRLAVQRQTVLSDQLQERALTLEQQATDLKVANDVATTQATLARQQTALALQLEQQARASRLSLLSLAAHDADAQALLAVEALQAANGPETEAAMWNALNRPARLPTLAQAGVARSVASADWKHVLTQGDDGSLVLWDVVQGREVARSQPDAQRGKTLLALTQDGSGVVLGGPSGALDLLVPQDGRLLTVPARAPSPHAGVALRALVLSPDGRWLASADVQGRTVLWAVDAQGLQPQQVLAAADGLPSGLAFDGRARWLAVASTTGGVRVHEVATGSLLTPPPPATAASAASAPAARAPGASAGTSVAARVRAPYRAPPRLYWAGERLLVLQGGKLDLRRAPGFVSEANPVQARQGDNELTEVIVGRRNQHVYTVSSDGVLATAAVRNQSLEPLRSWRYADVVRGRNAMPVSSQFGLFSESADGEWMAFTAGEDVDEQNHLVVASTALNGVVSAVRLHGGKPRAVGFAAEGRMLVAVTTAGIARYTLTDPLLAMPPAKLASGDAVELLAPTPDGGLIGIDVNGNPFRRPPVLPDKSSVPMLVALRSEAERRSHATVVSALAADGAGVAVAQMRGEGPNRAQLQWLPADGPPQQVPLGPDADLAVLALAAAAGGQLAWVAGESQERQVIRLWSPRAPGVVRRLQADGPVSRLVLSADGNRLAAVFDREPDGQPRGRSVGNKNATVATARLWQLPNDSRDPVPAGMVTWPGKAAAGIDLQFSPGGQWLAAQLDDRSTEVHRLGAGGAADRPLVLSANRVRFLPDDRRLLVADRENGLAVHALDQPAAAPQRLTAGLQEVTAVAVSASGQWLAAGLADGTVRIWDGRTLAPRALLRGGQRDTLAALAFGGDTLAAGDNAGVVVGWSLARLPALPSPVAALCNQVGSNMTKAAWDSAMGQRPYRRTCPGAPVDARVLQALVKDAWRAAEQRDQATALRLVRRIVAEAHDLSSPDSLNDLCYLAALTGHGSAVLPLCARALAARPGHGPTLDSHGVALALAGRLREAARDIDAAVRSDDFQEDLKAERGRWVPLLRQGINPIDLAWLAAERSSQR